MEDDGEQMVEVTDVDLGNEPMSDEDESDNEYEETEAERNMQYIDLPEQATMIFERHKDAVFISRTSPDGRHIASGGQDDRGFVFDLEGNLVLAFIGHKESVTSICWNCDSTLVASSDLSGIVKVWNVQSKKCVFECDEGDAEFVQFHPKGKSYLLTALSDGNSYFYNIKDGDFKVLPGPSGVACKSSSFLSEGRNVLIAYEDGSLRLFDIKNASQISTVQCKINEIVCMAVAPSEQYCVVGAGTGEITTIIIREGTLKIVHQMKTTDDEKVHPVEAIDIWKCGEMFAAASLSGFAYIYEPEKSREKIRFKLFHPDGVNGVKFCPGEKPRILTSCLDGKLRIWDCRSGQELITLHGHTDQILDLALEDYSCTTSSDDNTVRYWDLRELEEREENMNS